MKSHIVDVLGLTIGRDQPILRFEEALSILKVLDESILKDDSVAILDPCSKAGEILLAAAQSRCKSKNLLNKNKIANELFKKSKLFALSPDKRHHLLSKRTCLGNKKTHSKKLEEHFTNGDYLSEEDGRFNLNKFKQELNSMIDFILSDSKIKKIIAIGNPPYQEDDNGHGKSAKPVYSIFLETLMDHKEIDEVILVIPSRWFSGGKGLDVFRDRILKSNRIKLIKNFQNPHKVFPTVDINGGICFIHTTKEEQPLCTYIQDENQRSVKLSELDAIPDDVEGYRLIKKLNGITKDFMDQIVSSRNAFGITPKAAKELAQKKTSKKKIKCLVEKRTIIEIPKSVLSKNLDKINSYKVVVPAAVGGTKAVRDFLPKHQFFIVPPNVILSETYILIQEFEKLEKAEKLLSYLNTDFCRYFIGLRKMTQHLTTDCWRWVPQVPLSQTWTDDKLFKKFNFSKKDQAYIKKKVLEWS